MDCQRELFRFITCQFEIQTLNSRTNFFDIETIVLYILKKVTKFDWEYYP